MLGSCEDQGCHYVTGSNANPYCSGQNYHYNCMEKVPPIQAPICTELDVKLDLETDNYGSETSWELKDYGVLVDSGSGHASALI
mmetsp:Transcript_30305/g.39699  ORF Transcript_30305/g.39699 Transcript_30305/m.39699 type:complete len:84 (+) Transcript_30305:218-469(+)